MNLILAKVDPVPYYSTYIYVCESIIAKVENSQLAINRYLHLKTFLRYILRTPGLLVASLHAVLAKTVNFGNTCTLKCHV